MSNPEDPSTESPAPSAPPILDSNVQQSQTPVASRFSITRSWRIEDLYKNGSLALHGSGLLFSFLAFIIMVTNKHGDGRNFLDFEEYRYLVAIAILSTLYTGGHVFLQLHESLTNKQMFSLWNLAFFNFVGDQITAYLLISAGSSAVPVTNSLREGGDNIFTDSSAAAISMEFLAFFALAMSALI
ncbi:CASP-like protein 4B1 [Apium graveolens]|uniref:CASP-like protein 4B1 n=1 Tax=Apium graveolens TaxID=4045 RepID=UPI003D795961